MTEDLKKTLWLAADKLRANMDAAEYKHIVLGLIFLKYISDAFQLRRDTLGYSFSDQTGSPDCRKTRRKVRRVECS